MIDLSEEFDFVFKQPLRDAYPMVVIRSHDINGNLHIYYFDDRLPPSQWANKMEVINRFCIENTQWAIDFIKVDSKDDHLKAIAPFLL